MKYVLIVFLLCFIVGCQQDQLGDQTDNASNDQHMIQVKNSNPATQDTADNQDNAQYLANLATEVPDVENATALVTNRGVIVSIDVNKDLDRTQVGSIKYAVLEAVEHDPRGQEAMIIADADLNERLRGMANKIQEGQPLDAITEELANITGRWMPEVPVKEKQPDQTDQNKKMMDEKQEQKLDDIQEEQSNHHKD